MFKAKDIDTDLKNAFGDKDMIVLNWFIIYIVAVIK